MTIPLYTAKFTQPLNPLGDKVDFIYDASGRLLEVGETISGYTITLSAASIAAGLVLGSGVYAPSLMPSLTQVKFWLSIDPAHAGDAGFVAPGIWLDMILAITTSNSPARIRDRTLAVRVCQE